MKASTGSVIFDFDSTLITCESLEVILHHQLKSDPERYQALVELTNQGMSGTMDFNTALTKRLEIAAPSYQAVINFYQQYGTDIITPGIADVINLLQRNNITVYIISGGLYEAIMPFAKALNIPADHVYAVKLLWQKNGDFLGINPDDPFSKSKLVGCRSLTKQWSSPSIMVGDGFTDYEIFQHGLVDHFIAYAQHQQRQSVLDQASMIAYDTNQLTQLLTTLLTLC